MATETRSHHGCWSCRLRKKKCDERHPICTECMCVGLECHGFGEKPEWMDRGARQKAQAAKMKQKVAQVTKSRRMNQIRDQHESSMKRQQKQNSNINSKQDDSGEASSEQPPKNTSTWTGSVQMTKTASKESIHAQLQVPETPRTNHVFHVSVGDDLQQNANAGSTQQDTEKMHFPPPSSYHHDGLNVTIDALAGIDTTSLTGFQSMSLPSFHDLDFLSEHHFEVPMDLPDLYSDNSADGIAHRHHAGLALDDLNLAEALDMGSAPGYSSHHTVQVGAIKTITPTPTPTPIHTPLAMDFSTAWHGNFPVNMPMLQITNIEDAILFANYLDKAFHWQFPFCTSSSELSSFSDRNGEFNQGHYVWLMSRSKPLYLASLALSDSYSRLSSSLKNKKPGGFHHDVGSYPQPTYAEAEEQRTGYRTGYIGIGTERYETATQELQRNLKASRAHTAADDVAMLACIVSFITSSFLQPTQIDWNAHLKAGTALITSWIDQELYRLQHQQQYRDISAKTLHDYLPNLETCTPEESARTFFTSSIIRFDILSSLTSDSLPALTESYKQLLVQSHTTIDLESVSGCQSWVFSILLDVYVLRDWKRTTREAGLLSLWELTSKANTIQTELEGRIADNNRVINNLKSRNTTMKDHMDSMNMDTDMQSSDPNQHNKTTQTHLITQAFACAVSVLLEVIVSGAYPQLPEIKHKVARALEAFTDVASHLGQELVEASLGWPLFVVGCIIDEEHYMLFRKLLSPMHRPRSRATFIPTPISPVASGMGNMGMGLGVVKGAASHDRRLTGVLDLLERCWRGRETGEVRDDGFDYSHFRHGGRGLVGGDDGSFKEFAVLVA